MLFFPLFQLGQNTRWGSSAYLSPCRSQWWNGHCRNPKYLPHQRLPNFGEEKRKLMIFTSSQWITLDSLRFRSRKPVTAPHPGRSRNPCSQGWKWLPVSPAPSPARVTFSKHFIDLGRESDQKPSISSYLEWQLTKWGRLRTATKRWAFEGMPHVLEPNWPGSPR